MNPREPILLNSWRTVKTDEQGGTTQRSKLLKLQNYLKYCNQLPTVGKKRVSISYWPDINMHAMWLWGWVENLINLGQTISRLGLPP